MPTQPFAGDKKVGGSILHKLERRAIDWMVPKIPPWIQSYHLTLATVPISLLIVFFSYLAISDIRWMWGVSAMIASQYFTDLFDGAVGRYRNTGLIKWGYYMDHFLDYVFLCAIEIGYCFILPDHLKYLQFFILAIFAGYMVNSYLDFAATNEFRISHLGIGPTEVRLIFILVNTFLILFGKTYVGFLLPGILIFSALGLCYVVYQTQKRIWAIDMEKKKANQ